MRGDIVKDDGNDICPDSAKAGSPHEPMRTSVYNVRTNILGVNSRDANGTCCFQHRYGRGTFNKDGQLDIPIPP